MAQELWKEVLAEPGQYYAGIEWIVADIQALNDREPNDATLAKRVIDIIKKLNK